MLMGRNYSNIDLANKMECLSKRGYLLSSPKTTVHHLPKENFLHQRLRWHSGNGVKLLSKINHGLSCFFCLQLFH